MSNETKSQKFNFLKFTANILKMEAFYQNHLFVSVSLLSSPLIFVGEKIEICILY
jgi:hypothetical protein